jgi:hypothetical protein
MNYRFKRSMLSGHSGDVSLAVKRVIVRAVNRGLVVTSTRRLPRFPGDQSFHLQGRAVDVADKDGRRAPMVDFQRFLVRRFGCSAFLELIGPDNSLNCKNGRRMTLDEGSALEDQHDNHVHVVPSRAVVLPKRPRALIAKLRRRRSIRNAIKSGVPERFAELIHDKAAAANISYPLALALVQKESNFKNQFGHDRDRAGKLIFPAREGVVFVTKERAESYLIHARRTGLRQGVGLTQLTSGEYQDLAQKKGGLHRPSAQLEVGLNVLAGHIKALGKRRGIGAYNGGRGNPQIGYANDVIRRENDFRSKGVK